MIAPLPWLAGMLGLSHRQAAIWAGASIHEVAQVAVTASILGGSGLAIAMTVKLGRVALLAPLNIAVARGNREPEGGGVPLVPWFVIGFAVAATLRSAFAIPPEILNVTDAATTLLLAAGMFGLGLGLRLVGLWPVPSAAFVLAAASTTVAASVSLGLVVALT